MAKDTSIRNGPRTRAVAAVRSRTDELVREIDESAAEAGWLRLLSSRNFLLSAMVWAAFVVVVGVVVVATRESESVARGRVMDSTRIARVDFELFNKKGTEQAKLAARDRARRVYVAVPGVVDEIRASLENLPLAVLGVESPDRVEQGLQQQFGITPEVLTALQAETIEGQVLPSWTSRVRRLVGVLVRTPILESETFQKESTGQNREIELVLEGGAGEARPRLQVFSTAALNAASPRIAEDLRAIASGAGFSGVLLDMVVNRLANPAFLKPTYRLDSDASLANADAAAKKIEAVTQKVTKGDVVYARGSTLTEEMEDKLRQARAAERHERKAWQVWAQRGAMLTLVTAVTAAMAGYVALFVPRVRRKPLRTLGVAGLLAGATVIGCLATIVSPALIALTGVAPTVFATIILVVAYQQRVGLAFGALHGVLMCIALDEPIGLYAVMVAGIGVAVWQLREVRDRNALTRAGAAEAFALALGTFVVSLVELPPSREVFRQAGMDALLAGVGGFGVCLLALGLLPMLERTFGLVTGMTLIELRDPKQPLLRQLQQRAPGTYNHSLTIASLGEAAAEAIGADGLLTYVGALYHDIGKMNKPDYFVENQTPGFNRHDKLSPTMSLLVIVGHVKDGMELAREFNLPRALHHFIEAHHGTTLVEYFYHRAKRQAEAAAIRAGEEHEEAEIPTEIEYRYPGPKPRTKEAAILMLCDAVESASRTMADPTPARVDQLVRGIASKRLSDGQFDECDLTLRELNVIVETVSKTLASIYHGRIAYPSGTMPGGTGTVQVQAGTLPGTGGPGSAANGAPGGKDRASAAVR